jgi:hypothetical protein
VKEVTTCGAKFLLAAAAASAKFFLDRRLQEPDFKLIKPSMVRFTKC